MAKTSKKTSIMAIVGKIMKPIATTIATLATKSELEDAIDEVKNNAIVKDVPVSLDGETLVFEATADAEIDGETLILGEME